MESTENALVIETPEDSAPYISPSIKAWHEHATKQRARVESALAELKAKYEQHCERRVLRYTKNVGLLKFAPTHIKNKARDIGINPGV